MARAYSLSVTAEPILPWVRSPVSASVKPVLHQRARFAVGADHRHGTACLVEQVSDLAEIVGAVLAQQRVHVFAVSPARASPPAWSSPRATRTRAGWSISRTTRLCLRPITTRRCATRKVTSAIAEEANDVSDAVAPRP